MCACVRACVCVCSHCSEHPWRLRSEVFVPDKKSIFSLTAKPADEEAAEQYVDDDDDSDASELTVTGGTHGQLSDSRNVQPTVPVPGDLVAQLNVHDNCAQVR